MYVYVLVKGSYRIYGKGSSHHTHSVSRLRDGVVLLCPLSLLRDMRTFTRNHTRGRGRGTGPLLARSSEKVRVKLNVECVRGGAGGWSHDARI